MKKLIFISLVIFSCTQEKRVEQLDIQGHRGARGLMPENTMEGFIKAVDIGVNTLELDLSVTKDSQLIVSHEPFFSSEFCLDTLGSRVDESKQSDYNIYQMSYEETQRFDCGSIAHARFPDQMKLTTRKPLLKDVLSVIETKTASENLPAQHYNIELKTTREGDNVYHPRPEVFSDMVYQLITQENLWERVNIQSFDFRTLTYFHTRYPKVRLALLIENKLPWKTNIDSLGFTPEIYSCDYQLLSREIVSDLQAANMLVIPWTVNDTKEMKKLIDWGVDGFITDYPNRAIELVK
ncbi:MAG: glycerophosphodiester phosphodiesterase family protein [Bacteroidota bacterium]